MSKTRPVANAGLNLTNGGKGTVNVNGTIELYNYGSLWTGAPQFSMRPVVTYTVECLGSGKKIPVTANVQLSGDGKTATFGSLDDGRFTEQYFEERVTVNPPARS